MSLAARLKVLQNKLAPSTAVRVISRDSRVLSDSTGLERELLTIDLRVHAMTSEEIAAARAQTDAEFPDPLGEFGPDWLEDALNGSRSDLN